MKALVFGITGQDGYYLKNILLNNSIDVIGISRSDNRYIQGDISDFESVQALVKKFQPDFIFHLAANSTTRHSALFDNHLAISTGTFNILESAKLHAPHSRVFLSGSAMQFENRGIPIDEQTPFHAGSPYSVSRIHSVYAGRYYREKFGLKVFVGYFFNHDSPLRTESHINQKIVNVVKRISQGRNEKLELGDIDVEKEFNFAGDVMDAVWILMNQDTFFEAVIGSGKAYKIKDWIQLCFDFIGKNWEDYVIKKSEFIPEYSRLVSNPKLMMNMGWQPQKNIIQLVNLMMEG